MTLVLVPENSKNKGTGHIKRMSRLFFDLQQFDSIDVFVLIDGDGEENFPTKNIIKQQPSDKNIVYIIDKPQISQQELSEYIGYTIGIDTGGTARPFVNHLIDILPNTLSHKPHISSVGFLPSLPHYHPPKIPVSFKRILISFGGQDPNQLSKHLYDSGLLEKYFASAKVDMVKGSMMGWLQNDYFAKWNVIENKTSLDCEFFLQYDAVFLAFGITLFEALRCGVGVFALCHDEYNKSLCDNISVEALGVKKPNEEILQKLLCDKSYFARQFDIVKDIQNESLANYIVNHIKNI